jgi:hypothetical protein
VIFLEVDRQSIADVKFLLDYFENKSGLKINFQKSVVIVLELQKRVVQKLLDG